jgi:hypothetical protein
MPSPTDLSLREPPGALSSAQRPLDERRREVERSFEVARRRQIADYLWPDAERSLEPVPGYSEAHIRVNHPELRGHFGEPTDADRAFVAAFDAHRKRERDRHYRDRLAWIRAAERRRTSIGCGPPRPLGDVAVGARPRTPRPAPARRRGSQRSSAGGATGDPPDDEPAERRPTAILAPWASARFGHVNSAARELLRRLGEWP